MSEYKRAVEDKNYGPIVKTVMTRCIHCTRCIRFTEEVGGETSLGCSGRGKEMQVGTYIENLVTNELSGNVVDLCPVGALTSMPYAFTARPWELKSVLSVDPIESLGQNLEINIRGSEVMRVLPRLNEEVNEEWLSDKARYAFDGLKRQRLTVPMLRQEDGTFAELRWHEAMNVAKEQIEKVQGNEMCGIIGNFMDVESIVSFRDMLHRLGCEDIEVRNDAPQMDVDFRSQYLMNSRIAGIDDTDCLLLVGCNPRTEAPVLNARIRKYVQQAGLDVALLGTAENLTYDYKHIGSTTQSLEALLDGSHPFADKLANADLPMILVGSATFERNDGKAIYNTILKICEKYNVVSAEKEWNGFNVLHKEGSRPGAMDLGISSNREALAKKPKLIYLLGADNIRVDDIPEDSFVIYQGHHGDEGAYFADLILPGAGYTEKTATYVNTEGRVQIGRAAGATPGLARQDWEILRALSEELNVTLPYDTIHDVRARLAELAPHLVRYDYVEPHGFEHLALKPSNNAGDMFNSPLTDHIDNYYMTDSISRNSAVMARCTKELNPKKMVNFVPSSFA